MWTRSMKDVRRTRKPMAPDPPCKRKDVSFQRKEVSSYLGFGVPTISCSQATSFTTSGFNRYPFQSR